MGLFDKMFGRGAEAASQQPDAEKRFDELKQKYQTVLNAADQQHIQFQNLHVQDNKLFIKGTAPSDDAKNKFWDQIKLVNPNADDITADISVDESRAAAATVGGTQAGQTYTVKAGDSLWRIAQNKLGDGNRFMEIFYANRDKMDTPQSVIHPGNELKIPQS
jgi:nucleoid-associated protein YgaU